MRLQELLNNLRLITREEVYKNMILFEERIYEHLGRL